MVSIWLPEIRIASATSSSVSSDPEQISSGETLRRSSSKSSCATSATRFTLSAISWSAFFSCASSLIISSIASIMALPKNPLTSSKMFSSASMAPSSLTACVSARFPSPIRSSSKIPWPAYNLASCAACERICVRTISCASPSPAAAESIISSSCPRGISSIAARLSSYSFR